MTVYAYLRVSTIDQANSGLGMEAQEKRVRDYCQFKTLDLGEIVREEAESGKKPFLNRPQAAQLGMKLVKGDHVIFPKLDRAFRNAADFHKTMDWWRVRGIVVHFLDVQVDSASPMGRFFLGVMALIAEWEANRISERTREAMAAFKARGGRTSHLPPPGFKWVRTRCRWCVRGCDKCHQRGWKRAAAPDPNEFPLVRQIVAWYRGGMTLRNIWRHLLFSRTKTRDGTEWQLMRIHRAVRGWEWYEKFILKLEVPLTPEQVLAGDYHVPAETKEG